MKCQDIILCGLTAAGADGRGGNTAGRTKFTLKSHRSVNNLSCEARLKCGLISRTQNDNGGDT